jgi:hypothetical protein
VLSQQISVRANKQPLSQVLTDIRDEYDIQISFDNELLKQYNITLSQDFLSPEEAIENLLEDKKLAFEKMGDVFIIYPKKTEVVKTEILVQGKVVDEKTSEPLPFSHISLNEVNMITDFMGKFSCKIKSDSSLTLKASHLGYYIIDTMITFRESVLVELTPSVIGLKEIVVTNRPIEKSAQIGQRAGNMVLNHKIANFLPGYGDNSVFNLLRLMPGVLASGEATNELIIWGSYPGHSQVIFDGFTIYGLKNYNDNISSFNPLMAKDIQVYKGGFDAKFGERVGGIVNITGKNGNLKKPSFIAMLNNMTLNSMLEVPLSKKSSIVIAFRNTYYDLYNSDDINSLVRRNNDEDASNDINVIPDYRFRDINLKYSWHINDQDLFYISLYGANDRFAYLIDEQVNKYNVYKNTSETNQQLGGSVNYSKTWKNQLSSDFRVSYSNRESDYTDEYRVQHIYFDYTPIDYIVNSKNSLSETNIAIDNKKLINRNHTLEFGGGFYNNQVTNNENITDTNRFDLSNQSNRFYAMLQDNINLGKHTILKIGSRLTYVDNLNKWYVEPRLSISSQVLENLKINLAWGVYNQFVSKSYIVDNLGGYRYQWTISDNIDSPVLDAYHLVFGSTYSNKSWIVSLESFYKTTHHISRFFRSFYFNYSDVLNGDALSYGVDLYVQKDFKKHSAWVSYSLSKTEEKWPDLPFDDYRRAPQDQRHEVKFALMLNFSPFYFSTNYVYGSGFPKTPYNIWDEEENIPYSRWDASVVYKFLNRKIVGEAGVSVLNILNTQNIKSTNFERVPAYQSQIININEEAMPLTPTIYLKFTF